MTSLIGYYTLYYWIFNKIRIILQNDNGGVRVKIFNLDISLQVF